MYNIFMGSKAKKGFTIIEISLFLAIAGLIVAGVIVSTQGVLSRRRYEDSVQDITSQLRNIFASALNTQITGNEKLWSDCGTETTTGGRMTGRGNCVVYGVLAWGYNNDDGALILQSTKVIGLDYDYAVENDDTTHVTEAGSTLGIMQTIAKAGYLDTDNANRFVAFSPTKYEGRWEAGISNAYPVSGTDVLVDYDDPGFSILLLRSPQTGEYLSYFSNRPYMIGGNIAIVDSDETYSGSTVPFTDANYHFSSNTEGLFLCVNAGIGQGYNDGRHLIRIMPGTVSESSVRKEDRDLGEYKCD